MTGFDPDGAATIETRPSQIDSLTGLRIVAATFVFLSHVSRPDYLPSALRTFMAAGYNGVTIFFVLSGFVLTWNYADTMVRFDRRQLRSFAVARFARIYPLYLLVLAWTAAPYFVSGAATPNLWWHVFAAQAWHPDIDVAYAYNNPGWSIPVEIFLYACFPVVIIGLDRIRNSRRALLTVAAVSLAVVAGLALWFTLTGHADLPRTASDSAHRWLYRMPLTRLGDFVIGAVAALVVQHRHRLAATAQTLGAVGIVGIALTPALLATAWSYDSVYLIPIFLLLWGLASDRRSVISRVLGSRPMVIAGEASYAFYLLHFTLLGRLQFDGVDGWRGWAVATVLQYGMILLAAVGAHHLIERPARLWLRKVLGRRATN